MNGLIPFLFVAFTVPGFVLAVRALPPVEKLVFEGVKPWACDICSCFWSTVIWGVIAGCIWGAEGLVAAAPAYAASMGLLSVLSRPTTLPPPPSFGDDA